MLGDHRRNQLRGSRDRFADDVHEVQWLPAMLPKSRNQREEPPGDQLVHHVKAGKLQADELLLDNVFD
jgi:hypothetical protein